MGPLVQGPSARRSDRIRTAAFLAGGLVLGATATFAVVHLLGDVLRTSALAAEWRLGLAAAGLLAFAAADLLAIRRATYCPLGWRRQTPNVLLREHRMDVVAVVWGLDIGLAFTTFRVAALTWGALLLVGLGFAPWWTGAGYGLAIAIPLYVLLWRHRVGRVARDPVPADPGLAGMLDRRAVIQAASAILLTASATVMLTGAVA